MFSTAVHSEPRDSTALSEALEILLRDDATRSSMGKAARERFQTRYTQRVWLRAMEDALASVAEGRPALSGAHCDLEGSREETAVRPGATPSPQARQDLRL